MPMHCLRSKKTQDRRPGVGWLRRVVTRSLVAAGTLTAALLSTIASLPAQPEVNLSSCPAAAGKPTVEQVQAGMRAARDRGFLWRVSTGGRNSYLYGTLHIAKNDWMYLGATVLRALRASDRVALELDPLDPDIARRLNKARSISANDTALPEPLAARVRNEAERACFPLPILNTMFPEMQLITLGVLASRGNGMYPEYGSEPFLSRFARGLRKPVVSLETPELQMRAMRIGNPKDLIALAEKSLRQLETKRAQALQMRMAEAWANSRIDELERYAEWCECAETEAQRRYWRQVIDDRNPGLAEKIASMISTGGTVFAAVGSLHMFGANGLPALLTQRGYEVEFVPFSP